MGLAAVAARGQSGFAELSGIVTSSDGAPLRGVTVGARNIATGQHRSASTSDAGAYAIAGLRPGRYVVRFERADFATLENLDVELRLGETTRLTTTLQPAAISEVVTVSAAPHLIDVESNAVGGTLTSEEFRDLPTEDRNFVLFAALIPGIIPNPQSGSASSDALYINGQHQANNSFRVDGGRNDDPLAGSIAGAEVRTAIEAIQEFQILTAQYDAEFGSTTGGVLNAITKSGTNQLSGSAFAFFQNAKWNALGYFAKREGLARPDASFRSDGFTFGGPLVRDRLHYFVSFEQVLDREGHSTFFVSRPDLSFSTNENNHIRNVLARVDADVAPIHHFSIRYLGEQAPQFNKITSAQSTLEGALEEHDFDFNAIAALESALSASGFNSLRLSYTHNHFVNSPSVFGRWAPDFQTLSTFAPSQVRPSVVEGPNTLGQNQRDDSIDAADTASCLFRAHEVRAGFQWARRAVDVVNFNNANGRFTFDTDRPFDPNDSKTYPVTFQIRVHGPSRSQTSNVDTLGLFLQDAWHARSNLTLNAGLRWDRDDAVHDRNNFAPRLGFAWSPAPRSVIRGGLGRYYDETRLLQWSQFLIDSVRLTNGVVVRIPDAGTNRQLFANLIAANPIATLPQLRDVLTRSAEQTAVQLNLDPTVDNRNRVEPYVDTASIGAEHALSSTLVAGIDLIYSESKKTLVQVDLNPFSRALGGRPNISILEGKPVRLNSISTLLNAGSSRYTAAQISLQKRMRNSVAMRVAYTYSDSQGNYGNAGALGAPNTAYFQKRTATGYNFDTGEIIGDPLNLNLNDPRNEGQPVGWNRRHNLAVAGVWHVPHTGVALSSIYRYMSGDRFTIFSSDFLDNGNRAIAPAGTYSGQRFNGTMFGAENPDFHRLDVSVRYLLSFGKIGATLIGEVFNVANHANFVSAGGTIAGTSGFLAPTATYNSREFQLGARLRF